MAKYGLSYMGSKSIICDDLIPIFPKAENFYDLFGGGFSVTHAMLMKRRDHFNNFYFNDIRPGICELMQDSINGKYNYNVFSPKFISREEFFSRKDLDPYVKIVWSFGNNGKTYLFGKDIEQVKRSLHNAIVFNEFDDYAKEVLGCDKFQCGFGIIEKRLHLKSRIKFLKSQIIDLQQLQQLQQLERLEQLQRLEQLEQLQQLERLQQLEQLQQLERLQQLHFSNLSYDQVEIKPDSIIYCDPPYANTADYDADFNHKKFLDWADSQENPVFISEYKINDKRFRPMFKIKKVQRLSSKSRIQKNEMVYVNQAAFDLLMSRRMKQIHKESLAQ